MSVDSLNTSVARHSPSIAPHDALRHFVGVAGRAEKPRWWHNRADHHSRSWSAHSHTQASETGEKAGLSGVMPRRSARGPRADRPDGDAAQAHTTAKTLGEMGLSTGRCSGPGGCSQTGSSSTWRGTQNAATTHQAAAVLTGQTIIA